MGKDRERYQACYIDLGPWAKATKLAMNDGPVALY